MIKVAFTPPESKAWKDWCEEAKTATEQALADYAQGINPAVKEALYKKRRDDVFAAFHEKCAYCEAKISLDQPGDVEHFRPKGKVTGEDDQEIEVDDGQGGHRPHPGYFWLAYDWSNLLPSCARCNRPMKGPGGKLVGKWNRFPVDGAHALLPAEVATEKPVLLHPVFDDPAEHFGIDPDTGIIFSKTPRGEACIRILGLNREGLPEARRDVFDNVMARAKQQNAAFVDNDTKKMQKDLRYLEGIKEGSAEYSMAGRIALERVRAALLAQLAALGG